MYTQPALLLVRPETLRAGTANAPLVSVWRRGTTYETPPVPRLTCATGPAVMVPWNSVATRGGLLPSLYLPQASAPTITSLLESK